ncbi:parallel beta-helix repeat-containing protein [Solimonas aquatica]|uniref:Parallel beta-helix repeat-containing protein n=1 Tax=Solimonas aquatica TaxID=489703 RepID=A0A1H9EI30_9GAMM|nr:parallel beta-helix domain-containing protein [Solimonas aquatica]SEQ25331.1 parallel beta-helix repeat-containing protein [Solimonas aquatica]
MRKGLKTAAMAAGGLALLTLAACGGGSPDSGATSGGSSGGASSTPSSGSISTGSSSGSDSASSGSASSGGASTGSSSSSSEGRIFQINPGSNATRDMIAAMVQAAPGDVIRFSCGYFELSSSLLITHTEDVLISGCGREGTVLSFKHNNAPEGILVVSARGITVQDLTVLDTGGNGVELRGVDHGTIRRVRAMWSSGGGRESADPITGSNYLTRLSVPCTDPATQNPEDPLAVLGDTHSPDYTVSRKSGRYGIYPVSSQNILIENAESIGASDAGIYVGQTNTAIIRNSRSAFNVFGFEIENVQGGEYDSNLAECNTGGFLIYDLDGLRQYGERSRMHGNIARMNNTYNFTSGGFVGNVPAGSGMITLAYDQIDVFDNEFRDNNTAGIIHTSYEIFPEGAGRPSEKRIDWYTEGLHIFHNKFVNNGNQLPLPSLQDILSQNLSRFLPAIVGLKNQAACGILTNLLACPRTLLQVQPPALLDVRGAHIIWDGLLDTYDAGCPYPLDAEGKPVPANAYGKPQLGNDVPNPSCHYNKYKFNTAASGAPRIKPEWFSCIDADNDFARDSIKYANFHGTKGLELIVSSKLDLRALAQLPSDLDMSPHDCVARYGKNLPLLPPITIPPFVRSGDYDPAPTAEKIAALCGASVPAGEVNFAASSVNCPTLDQYHLFSNAQDPRSTPNGQGTPYGLNSKLFSDYAVKYRVVFLPPGTHGTYRDAASDGANATLVFPTGTIIAKTFAFADETVGSETPLETRLLIKRVNSKGQVRWDGLVYVWRNVGGQFVAQLAMGGETDSVHWVTTDVDSGVRHVGSTTSYTVPNANQCLNCHSREDQEPGAAPIGTKVRFMNRAWRPESLRVSGLSQHPERGLNQIQWWCDHGLLAGCPSDLGVDGATQIAGKLERSPTFNKPGDAGYAAGSAQDIEARARAWLEVNCQHCHNARGFAANTGFYLDSLRKVDGGYGICKRPTATGQEGNGGRSYDIHPGLSADSIVEFRIGPTALTPAARMPPLARSVVDEEGHALVQLWIDSVTRADEAAYPGSTSCAK